MKPPRWLLKLFGPPKGRHALRATSSQPRDAAEAGARHRQMPPPANEPYLDADPAAPELNDDEPPVRLIFADGTVGSFVTGSEEERRARYLASHLLSLR